ELNSDICERLQLKRFFFCYFCERFMFTKRHVLMHISCPKHKEKMNCKPGLKRANELLKEMLGKETRTEIQSWFEKETEDLRLHRHRWSWMGMEHPELRPTKKVADNGGKEFRYKVAARAQSETVTSKKIVTTLSTAT
ncbi:hypothetical protein PMAYCL1PPCAC_00457, partial [Pristionchus mayeri]